MAAATAPRPRLLNQRPRRRLLTGWPRWGTAKMTMFRVRCRQGRAGGLGSEREERDGVSCVFCKNVCMCLTPLTISLSSIFAAAPGRVAAQHHVERQRGRDHANRARANASGRRHRARPQPRCSRARCSRPCQREWGGGRASAPGRQGGDRGEKAGRAQCCDRGARRARAQEGGRREAGHQLDGADG